MTWWSRLSGTIARARRGHLRLSWRALSEKDDGSRDRPGHDTEQLPVLEKTIAYSALWIVVPRCRSVQLMMSVSESAQFTSSTLAMGRQWAQDDSTNSDISSLGWGDLQLLAHPSYQRPPILHVVGWGIALNTVGKFLVGHHQPKLGGQQYSIPARQRYWSLAEHHCATPGQQSVARCAHWVLVNGL
jgi:hypothetical protein